MSVPSSIALWPELPGNDRRSTYALHAQLLFTQWMDADLFRRFQLRHLENLLRFAGRFSPYRTEALKFLETWPRGELYPEQLAQIPVMNLADLQKSSPQIIVRKRLSNHGKSRMIRVAVPKGPPVKMMVSGLVDSWSKALDLRSLDWHESDVAMTCARLRPEPVKQKPGTDERWSVLPWSGPLRVIDPKRSITDVLEELMRINPGSLQTEPQILQRLLERAVSQESGPENLREIRCRGRFLDPGLREAAETAWGIPIIHEYYLEEIGVIAHQCPSHEGLHVNAEFVHVEILDELGNSCRTGETGRVVVTPLQNFKTPLIRYDTGDLAEAGEPCGCGRTLPVLKRIFS